MSINIGVNIQRSPNRINQALRAAGVNGQYPKLLFDFDDEYYLTNGSSKTFANAMTFARAGNATMVDSDGLIKWAPHNLLSYSEQFDNAYWTKATCTVTANAIVAPDGTATADTFESTSAGYSSVYRILTTVTGAPYTLAVFAKAGTATTLGLEMRGSATAPDTVFNLSTGTITSGSGEITDVGNGWYLCSITKDAVDTSEIFIIGRGLYGPSGDTLYLWGAHVYRSDLGGMVNNPDRGDSYVPTTSSAVYLPRRGHHKYNGDQWVNKGILVESEARTNLITYSNDFSDTSWTKTAVGLSSDSTTAPDGSVAVKMFETAFSGSHDLRITSSTASASRISVYVKQGERRYCKFYSTGQVGVYFFDLQEGTIQTSWTTGTGATITPEGNGWHRISVPAPSAVSGNIIFLIGTAIDSTGNHTGDGSSGIYIYGAQVELTSGQASSYIPTNGSSVTRAAETVTVPYANLPWPTPTYIGDELVTNGTFDTDLTGWYAAVSGTRGNITWNSGTVVVDNSLSTYNAAVQSIATEAGKVYILEAELVAVTGTSSQCALAATNNSAGTSVFASNSNLSIGENRLIFVAQQATTYIVLGAGISTNTTFDNVSVREINPLSVSIAMMGEMNYADYELFDKPIMFRWYDSLTDRIFMSLDTNNGTGEPKFYQEANDVADFTQGDGSYFAPALNVPFNIASRHGSTFINGAVDGTALTADTTPVALPDLSTTNLNLAYDFMGTISEFRIFDRDIGDTGIAEATKPSLEPSLSLTFDGQPSSFTNTGLTV